MLIRSTATFDTGVVIDHPEPLNLYGGQSGAEATTSAGDLDDMISLTLTEDRLCDAIPWIFFARQTNLHFLRLDSSTRQIRS